MSALSLMNKLKPLIFGNNLRILGSCNQFSVQTHSPINTSQVKKPKKPFIPRITLISADNIAISTLEDAQRLAKRRDLKLVKILDLDTKTQRPVYKLMTGTEYHQEDLKQREAKKNERINSNALRGEKLLILNSTIAEHDLNVHINKILKWVEKRYEVRVMINGDMEKADNIYKFIENKAQDVGKLLQKRQKGNDMKFQIIPQKRNSSSGNDDHKKS
ncbi:PREDICTED: translation initiation factor IF-3 [Nicrophorus vespilloides]|uniref:Translation initiation factor IF-3 n=1 Tax=Nicrophorus vespilloides TaxID=110193 RepID=A0ABM1M0F8_NICVS|nr:PREDICTED: translation initiation factor IF-3 [Nicrophorus vespilloides]